MTPKHSNYFVLIAPVLLSCNIATTYALDIASDIKSAPASITNVYSDIDMRMHLATKPNAMACVGEQCEMNNAFDRQIQRLGARVASDAYKAYPKLGKRISVFTFSVADKKEVGMASNASGKVVVFRGVQYLELSEEAISFILAREMGHIIGRHHNKNTTTKILFSVLTSILFPAATLLAASHVAVEASTAVTSATSYFGAEVTISKIRPNQLTESDNIAITLLEAQNWDERSAASILQFDTVNMNGWLKDMQTTVHYLNNQIDKSNASGQSI